MSDQTKRRIITIALLITCVVLLVVWDIHVAYVERAIQPGQGDTISEITLGFAQRHPVLPFVIGVVCGHLLWFQLRGKAK